MVKRKKHFSLKKNEIQSIGIDYEMGLAFCGGTEEAYIRILRAYTRITADIIKDLNRYIEDNNLKDYRIKIHALKSISKTIGAAEMGEIAEKSEKACKENDGDYVKGVHKEVCTMAEELIEKIKKGIGEERREKERGMRIDKEKQDKLLYDILEYAQKFDINGIDNIISELEGYELRTGIRELISKIKELAEGFEYEEIERLIKEITEEN